MKTTINTIHEEWYITNDEKRQYIGVIVNYDDNGEKVNSYPFSLKLTDNPVYVIFNTFVDLINYLYYGNNSDKLIRYYIPESTFDDLYDNGIDGTLDDYLTANNNK